MSCEECSRIQDEAGVCGAYYYRWKNANIALIGCPQHIEEIINFLNDKEK